MNHIKKDPLHRKIEIINWVILALLVLISMISMPIAFALGVLLGGLVSIVNFYWIYRSLQGVFSHSAGTAKFLVMSRYYMRLAVIAVVLFFIVTNDYVDVRGVFLGLSVVIVNLVLTTLVTLLKKNCLEEVK
ncbi:MAG: ATP synthase subunit I [Syntrophobacterales bacterium]|nr:ATP synthase subunit I [Syntrophobacterales bacterium]